MSLPSINVLPLRVGFSIFTRRLEEERQRLRRELTALERLEGDKDARLKECTSLETELQTECAT